MLRQSLRDVEIWFTVVRSWIALRFWPARELALAFATSGDGRASDSSLVAAFRRATRPISKGRCVLLGVALLRLLRRRGMDAVLRVGFDIAGGKIAGHAWVESGSKVQGDAATIAQRFKPFNITAAGLAAHLSRRRAANHVEDSLEF